MLLKIFQRCIEMQNHIAMSCRVCPRGCFLEATKEAGEDWPHTHKELFDAYVEEAGWG